MEYNPLFYSASNSQTQIKVKGWKKVNSNSNVEVFCNGEFVSIHIKGVSWSAPTSFNDKGSIFDDTSGTYRPYQPVVFYENEGTMLIRVRDNSDQISVKSTTGNTQNARNVYAHCIYRKK